jgi:hypothetical protein
MYLVSNKDVYHSITTLCCGHINCKDGVHDIKDLVCIDDMMTGSCMCPTQQKIDEDIMKINDDIALLRKQLETSVDAEGYMVKLSKKVKDIILANIAKLESDKSHNVIRMIHYTDQKLVPMSVRITESKKNTVVQTDLTKIEVTPVIKVVKKKY